MRMPDRRLDLSVLIPVFNEVDNVEPLHAELDAVLARQPMRYELIFVNDGSTDGTAAQLEAIQRSDPEHVRVAFLRRNCGQTAALSAALDQARGEILVPMDGDRQNDPADIPRLLEQLDAGFDVVSGWRKDRHDALISRKVPSWIANRLIARLSGCTAARLRLHAEGVSPERARRGPALRRDAPIHPDLRRLARGDGSPSWSSIIVRGPPGRPSTEWAGPSTSSWT